MLLGRQLFVQARKLPTGIIAELVFLKFLLYSARNLAIIFVIPYNGKKYWEWQKEKYNG